VKARLIALPLARGEIRLRTYGRLPRAVKEGLRAIARSENKSMSWVVEEVLIDYFDLKRPNYKKERPRKIKRPATVLRMVKRA